MTTVGENQFSHEAWCVCKLKHDIRVESKIELAKREVETSLETSVQTLTTLPTLFKSDPFSKLDDKVIDRMTRLLYLGKAHGFVTRVRDLTLLARLARMATYLREIYGIINTSKSNLTKIVRTLSPRSVKPENALEVDRFLTLSPTIQMYNQPPERGSFLTTIFFTPLQTLLEYASEVTKLPYVTFTKQFTNISEKLDKMEEGVERGIQNLLHHLMSNSKRMPWLGLFKEHIGDYIDWAFSDFRTWGLHFIHKHEGKADPWLARSALNLLQVREGANVLDPFCGSGSFIADAPLLNINAIGVDVNPLSAMIARTKCNLSNIPLHQLKESLLKALKKSSEANNTSGRIESLELDDDSVKKFPCVRDVIPEFLSIKDAIDDVSGEGLVRDFLYSMLSRSIVEASAKQEKRSIIRKNFEKDAIAFYLYAYASQEILRTLNINVEGKITIFTANALDIKSLLDSEIDGIVTSPPYFDALDYVGFSKLPIAILGLKGNNERLETETIGSKDRMASDVDPKSLGNQLPESSRSLVAELARSGRRKKARVVLQYLTDMEKSLQVFSEVLREKSRIIFVVGKYHQWKIGNSIMQMDGAQVLIDIGEHIGLVLEEELPHDISKIEAGKRIKEESIIIWRKDDKAKSKRDPARSKSILKSISERS
ncbi:MAG: hypothetical protein WED05_06415 [Candidatus Atabeyarchaeum deiterrae]